MILKDKLYDLVAAGHICLDIIPEIPDTGASRMDQIFRPGSLLNVGPCTVSTGGPVSNTGLGAVKLGCSVAFMAKVGEDEHGQIIRRLLDQSGSSEGVHASPGVSSSYTVALAPPNIDRMFLHCPGANDTFTSEDITYDIVKHAGQFHLGYPPLMRGLYEDEGRELAEIFRRAKLAGATTSLDMSLPDPASPSGQAPWLKILTNVLPHVDIFLPSMEEAFFMLCTQDYLARKKQQGGGELLEHISEEECSTMAKVFLDMGVCMTALKSGHRGYYFRTADKSTFSRMGAVKPADPDNWSRRELWCPAFRVDAMGSATGSGDSSIAGFIAAFLRGLPIEACLKVANCTGYQNLHALDALSGIKSWDETWAMINDGGLPMIDPKISDEGWRKDDVAALWVGPGDGE
jgi:sugar/nucleoside kinase (ribokinase family)